MFIVCIVAGALAVAMAIGLIAEFVSLAVGFAQGCNADDEEDDNQ
jgi:hypothetical protein